MKLDYSIDSLDGRKQLVQAIIDSKELLSQKQLGYLADYLLFVADSRRRAIP